MWSLGLLMLDLMGGRRPAEQKPILESMAYREATQQMQRLPAHLQYLANQLTDPVPYADKVHSIFKQMTHFAACDTVKIHALHVLQKA